MHAARARPATVGPGVTSDVDFVCFAGLAWLLQCEGSPFKTDLWAAYVEAMRAHRAERPNDVMIANDKLRKSNTLSQDLQDVIGSLDRYHHC